MFGKNSQKYLLFFFNEPPFELIAVYFPSNVCSALNAGCTSGLQLLEPVIPLQIHTCSCNELQVL